jgi:hypothetical protein
LSTRHADSSQRSLPRQLRHIEGARRHIETEGGMSLQLADLGRGHIATADLTARSDDHENA